MARTRHIAGVLGLLASTATPRAPARRCARGARAGGARRRDRPARDGPAGGCHRDRAARERGHDHPRDRRRGVPAGAERLWDERSARARRDLLARGDPRRDDRHGSDTSRSSSRPRIDRALQWSIAVLVVAQAAVVGLQVVGRHVLRQPIPWTEEDRAAAARLADVRRRRSRRCCTGSIRASPRSSRLLADRGARRSIAACGSCCWRSSVCLIVPAWRLTVDERGRAAAGQRAVGRGDFRGAAGRALLLMSAVLVQQLRRDGRRRLARSAIARWRGRSARPALAIASVLVPLLAGAAPLVVLVTGFLVTAALGMPLAFTLALTVADLSAGHRRRRA